MGETVSVRLNKREIQFIEDWSKKNEIDKSSATRELIECGKTYLLIKLYKDSRVSIGKISKELGLSISEVIDMLAEFGIKSPISYEDYMKGFELERVL